jgi:hypothetical protein
MLKSSASEMQLDSTAIKRRHRVFFRHPQSDLPALSVVHGAYSHLIFLLLNFCVGFLYAVASSINMSPSSAFPFRINPKFNALIGRKVKNVENCSVDYLMKRGAGRNFPLCAWYLCLEFPITSLRPCYCKLSTSNLSIFAMFAILSL